MGFLDNSGDIILDAVLTDTGRMRLSKGDGSFRVVKFALGDDEIDYSLYNSSNTSGSAYFDLEILQTPVFEAFTNNGSNMKNKLVSIARNNIIYLPVLKLNPQIDGFGVTIPQLVNQGFILAVDKTTEDFFTQNINRSGLKYQGNTVRTTGLLLGENPNQGGSIRVDQGIDNAKVPAALPGGLDADLIETQYIVEIDNRLVGLVDYATGKTPAIPSYIDDDNKASYYFSVSDPNSYVAPNRDITTSTQQVIAGARGSTITFRLKASLDTNTSDYLFNQFGTAFSTSDFTPASGASLTSAYSNMRSIITNINITGVTTGFGIDIPLRLIKKIT